MTLEQMLTLAGRLDDVPGFDAPRERFRRFLREYVQDVSTARVLIEQCQHVPGEQHHRALQDLIVLLGRFLGFEVVFGSLTQMTARQHRGYWQSASRLHVALDVTAPGSSLAVTAAFPRSVAAITATPLMAGARLAGLFVVAPLSIDRRRVEEAVQAAALGVPVSVMTLQGVLSLAEIVSSGRATHSDVVRLFESALPLDFIVGLLERSAHSRPLEAAAVPPPAYAPPRDGPSFWIATVTPDYGTTPEEFLELVVAKRHVFGITDKGPALGTVRTGDSICFYLPRKGVVGHARVGSLVDNDGSSGIRDARRFGQVLRLEDLRLHLDRPVAPDPETELRLRRAPSGVGRHAQTLVEISREGFVAMTLTDARAEPRSDSAADDAAAERLFR